MQTTHNLVGSHGKVLWMFLFGANLAWFPTMYFRCPACGHQCLGQWSLGCGLLWDDHSPRHLGDCELSLLKSLITRVPGNNWARMMGNSVSLSLRSTSTRKQSLVSRQMPPNTHFPSIARPWWYFFLPNLDPLIQRGMNKFYFSCGIWPIVEKKRCILLGIIAMLILLWKFFQRKVEQTVITDLCSIVVEAMVW